MAVRWGVLGAARIARQAVIPAIQAAGGVVEVLGSRSLERGLETARALGVAEVVEGYQGVLDRDLDCVYIPLPNSLHKRWVLEALRRGRHVLCEKPLALSAVEAVEMDQAARAHQRLLGEAVMYRYHPRWALVHSLIGDGVIGELRQISGNFSFPLEGDDDYRWDPGLGGGALYDVGSYLINAARWIAGREPDLAEAVAAWRGGVDQAASVSLRFPGSGASAPCLAGLACGFAAAEAQWLAIEGTKGGILLDRPFTAWHGEALPISLRVGSGLVQQIPAPPADPYLEMIRAFHRAMDTGEVLLTSAADGAANLAVLDACRLSLAQPGARPLAVRQRLSGRLDPASSA